MKFNREFLENNTTKRVQGNIISFLLCSILERQDVIVMTKQEEEMLSAVREHVKANILEMTEDEC